MAISAGSNARPGSIPGISRANGHGTRETAPERSFVAAVLVISERASEAHVKRLVEVLRSRDVDASYFHVGPGAILLEEVRPSQIDELAGDCPAVSRAFIPETRYRLVHRDIAPSGTVVRIGDVAFGGDEFVVVAGPCAVESRSQLVASARAVAASGGVVLRGGAFKPRTSPYDFQGLGMRGVEILAEARRATGLPFVTEIMEPSHIEEMYALVDGFQVGARNMQNYQLLKALADTDKPVLLKRGPGATVEEWLLAAEYLLTGGNSQVVMCERGIRTFNTGTRFTLDLAAVAFVKRESHLPVIADPSHATGRPELVGPMAQAALAAGADGIMVEVHPNPNAALSDGFQALSPMAFDRLMRALEPLADAAGRPLARPRNPGRESCEPAPEPGRQD